MRAAISRDVVSVLERARDEWGSKPLVASGSVSFLPSQYLDVDRMPGSGEGCVLGLHATGTATRLHSILKSGFVLPGSQNPFYG